MVLGWRESAWGLDNIEHQQDPVDHRSQNIDQQDGAKVSWVNIVKNRPIVADERLQRPSQKQ